MDIFVLSKKDSAKFDYQDKHCWISINDPTDNDWWFKRNDHTVDTLQLQFDDSTNQESWQAVGYKNFYKRDAVLFDEAMAQQIFDFVEKNKNKVEAFIVNCHAGVSRSSGIGSFLNSYFNHNSKFQTPPHHPNSRVRKYLRHIWYKNTGVLIP